MREDSGYLDMEARIPMTTDKAFIIASVSKTVYNYGYNDVKRKRLARL